VDVHFAQAVAIVIAGKLASPMVDTLMAVAPATQASINAVLVRIHTCPWHDGGFDQGLDGLLLHIRQEIDHYLTTPLHHPKDGRAFLLQCTSTRFALESASTSCSLFALDHLWLAFVASNHIGFVALHLIGECHRRLFLRNSL